MRWPGGGKWHEPLASIHLDDLAVGRQAAHLAAVGRLVHRAVVDRRQQIGSRQFLPCSASRQMTRDGSWC
jgi:hypothetical protein